MSYKGSSFITDKTISSAGAKTPTENAKKPQEVLDVVLPCDTARTIIQMSRRDICRCKTPRSNRTRERQLSGNVRWCSLLPTQETLVLFRWLRFDFCWCFPHPRPRSTLVVVSRGKKYPPPQSLRGVGTFKRKNTYA